MREPAEGTMLTVFREMAHSLARQLAHLEADKQRLGRDVGEEQQDAILAEVLERAIEDGERAVARTPEQLEVLRESPVRTIPATPRRFPGEVAGSAVVV